MSNPLRLGLVGLGKIARDQHLPAIAETAGIELVAVASPHDRAEGLPSYPDIATMLAAESSLDAVALCMPPQGRFAAARAALQAGKHVLLEKPPGATVSEVEALISLATAHRLTIFTAWHSRYGAAVREATEWVATRAVDRVTITWKEDVRIWHPGQDWVWQPGGFGVFDPGINALSILTAVIGDVVRLIGAVLETPVNRQAPIAARLALETAGGAPIAAEFDFRQTGPQTWDIVIEAGGSSLCLSGGGNRLSIDGESREVEHEQEYLAIYRHFVHLIQSRQSDVDLAPLQLVADAFLRGRACISEAFDD